MNIDAMLKRKEAAAWLRISEDELRQKSTGPDAVIPVFQLGQRTQLYHPRTILASEARRAGVPVEVIAASFGITQKGQSA